jgi:hypothetical protein
LGIALTYKIAAISSTVGRAEATGAPITCVNHFDHRSASGGDALNDTFGMSHQGCTWLNDASIAIDQSPALRQSIIPIERMSRAAFLIKDEVVKRVELNGGRLLALEALQKQV